MMQAILQGKNATTINNSQLTQYLQVTKSAPLDSEMKLKIVSDRLKCNLGTKLNIKAKFHLILVLFSLATLIAVIVVH